MITKIKDDIVHICCDQTKEKISVFDDTRVYRYDYKGEISWSLEICYGENPDMGYPTTVEAEHIKFCPYCGKDLDGDFKEYENNNCKHENTEIVQRIERHTVNNKHINISVDVKHCKDCDTDVFDPNLDSITEDELYAIYETLYGRS